MNNRLYLLLSIVAFSIGLSGCASYGIIANKPIDEVKIDTGYSVSSFSDAISKHSYGNSILVAFSGGGTRAAALSYGVLEELKNTAIADNNRSHSMLDEVRVISSVSGGSFTAAYFGLHGDRIFDDYKERFLTKNVKTRLVNSILNPLHWFSKKSRTDYAVSLYDKEIFDGATFSDMNRENAPMILINATDLSRGVRFSFMQEYFNLLCSDLSGYSVSSAVAASSAVPLLFSPVVVKNHDGCASEAPQWLVKAKERAKNDPELSLVLEGLESYDDKENVRFAHFVDGGISDNLGLRSIFDFARLAGGAEEFLDYFKIKLGSRIVIVSVDASTNPESSMARFQKSPSLASTISAMSSIQLHRYNTATVSEMKRSMEDWVSDMSNTSNPVDAYFIRISFDDIQDEKLRKYLNKIPTSFALSEEQVGATIQAGRYLLKQNPEFQRLLKSQND